MEVIHTEKEIEGNLRTFEDYLCEGSDEAQQFAHELIAGGRCFIAYQVNAELRFSPSRYAGYLHNTMRKHDLNLDKDGRETNAAINKVIGYTPEPSQDLEEEFLRFASGLGVEPHNKPRKYWQFKISGTGFGSNISSDDEFPEGKLVERKHKARERNSKLASAAKEKFIKDNGRLYCIVCEFDFEKTYGKRGDGYIEAHHTMPVSEMRPGDKTKIEDIALVCANCHRMLHRIRPWLKIDGLKKILDT